MSLAKQRVDQVLDSPILRLALVQLSSPFTGPAPELKFEDNVTLGLPQFVWTEKHYIERRKTKTHTILTNLEKFKPHLIVFPEYSVPQDCHPEFQSFVDANNCILVPGSYYEYDKKSKHFRQNVCTIFLPAEEPVTIFKRHGYLRELKAINVSDDDPNIARLTWTASEGGRDYSINVFLCRDYLIPYDSDHISDGVPESVRS